MDINQNDMFRIKRNVCKCCHGTGVQYNKTNGLTVFCPCCHGSGQGKNVKPYRRFT